MTSLISSDQLREQIRRRIAVEEGELSTSIGEIGSDDGEDSPLQSKRSSMLMEPYLCTHYNYPTLCAI